MRRWVVVGAGAVGGSIAGLLQESGACVARGEHGAVLRSRGLRLRLPERDLLLHLECFERVGQVDWRAGDVALLATKLQDARAALDELLAAAGPALPVVCATNGIHAELWSAERFERVLAMLVWLPAVHLLPGEVRLHTSGVRGVLDCGPHPPGGGLELASELCAGLCEAGFDAVARHDIAAWKHAKWITNLGAAAQALGLEDWRDVARAAQAEGERVLDAAGLPRVSPSALRERVAAVRDAPIAGQDRPGSSTWQSRARGKPLESAWIEGALARLAAELGVPAPVNAALAAAATAG